MLKSLPQYVAAFDAEWVPNAALAKLLYGFDGTELEIWEQLWEKYRFSSGEARPYLKEGLCQIVSLARVERFEAIRGKPKLSLTSRIARNLDQEVKLVANFLGACGDKEPILVGYNHTKADLKILVQRAMALGVQSKTFLQKPSKPWEGRDYLNPKNDWVFDLHSQLNCGAYQGALSLHEAAVMCGIPGKLGTAGADVVDLWLARDYDTIRSYNICDALTTYLLFLRICYVNELFEASVYRAEQALVLELILDHIELPLMRAYLNKWRDLQEALGQPFAQDLHSGWNLEQR